MPGVSHLPHVGGNAGREGEKKAGGGERMSIAELWKQYEAAKMQSSQLWEKLRVQRERLADMDSIYMMNYGSMCATPYATLAPTIGEKEDHLHLGYEVGPIIGQVLLAAIVTNHSNARLVYSLDWSREKNYIASVSQDGRLIVWNALTSQKIHAIKLPCPWVMACAFSPDGQAVASGGLDNVCSIFNLSSQPDLDGNLAYNMLHGHKGYISCCKYLYGHEAQLVTSSGDHTCALWDSETCQRITVFGGDTPAGHTADVMSVSVSSNPQSFVSGSCDTTARLWDTRTPNRAVHTFHGHHGDVNSVSYLPDGFQICTGSDDSTCRIFDTRTGHQLQVYTGPGNDNNEANIVKSVAFSFSGRLIFASYSNGDCLIWDTVTAEVVMNLKKQSNHHTSRVSCLGLASDGSALCTGSWDKNLKIWAFSGQRRMV